MMPQAAREVAPRAYKPDRGGAAMSPATHWTPAGLEATRQFWAGVTR